MVGVTVEEIGVTVGGTCVLVGADVGGTGVAVGGAGVFVGVELGVWVGVSAAGTVRRIAPPLPTIHTLFASLPQI